MDFINQYVEASKQVARLIDSLQPKAGVGRRLFKPVPVDTEILLITPPFNRPIEDGRGRYMLRRGNNSSVLSSSNLGTTKWSVVPMDSFPGGVGKFGIRAKKGGNIFVYVRSGVTSTGELGEVLNETTLISSATVSAESMWDVFSYPGNGVAFRSVFSGGFLTLGDGLRQVYESEVLTDRARFIWEEYLG